MHRRDDWDRPRRDVVEFSPVLSQPEGRSQQRVRCSGPHGHNDVRLNHFDFGLQPRPAGLHLPRAGFGVQPPLAPLFPFEMFDRIGDEHFVAVDSGILQCPVENPAGRSDERTSDTVFDIAGLLADQHHRGAWRTFSENSLRGAFIKITAHAMRRGRLQLRKGRARRNKRSRGFKLDGFFFFQGAHIFFTADALPIFSHIRGQERVNCRSVFFRSNMYRAASPPLPEANKSVNLVRSSAGFREVVQ